MPTKTKITGTAQVGYVKDNKSIPPNQKVKAVTACIPSVSVSEGVGNFSSDQDHHLPTTVVSLVAEVRAEQNPKSTLFGNNHHLLDLYTYGYYGCL